MFEKIPCSETLSPFETPLHRLLSIISWSTVDDALKDKTYDGKEILQTYFYVWTTVGETMLEETPWNDT